MKDKFILEKSFFKMVFAVAIPIAMQNVISFGVNAMDSIMLGKLGNIAVSGASLGGQPFFLITLLGFGLTGGGSVLIAQYWGKGNVEVIKKIMRISMLVITIVSFLATLVCYNFSYEIMCIFSNEEEVIVAASSYLKMLSLGFMFYAISNNYMMSMRAVEEVKVSTAIYACSFFVNVFFNYIFIFGEFGMKSYGIVGAAMGTTIARLFEFTSVVIYMYFKEKKIGYKIHCMFKIDKNLIKDYMTNALPVVGSEMMWAVGTVSTTIIIGNIGSTFVTANSMTMVIYQLASVATFGIANASAVVCGKTIGEGSKERAQKTANTLLILAVSFGLLSCLMVLIIKDSFISIYDVTDDAKVIASQMMFALALFQPLYSVDVTSIVGILRGGADTKIALILDAGGMWLINIPLGILTGFVLKLPAPIVYASMRSDLFIKVTVEFIRITSGKWIRTVAKDDI